MNSDVPRQPQRTLQWGIIGVTTGLIALLLGSSLAANAATPSALFLSPRPLTPRGQLPAASRTAVSTTSSTGQGLVHPLGRGSQPAQVLTATQDFQDVPTTNNFFPFLHAIYQAGIVAGYGCGGINEPCVGPLNRPYYRPTAAVTRGQMTKFVDLARHTPGIAISSNSDALPVSANSDAPAGTGLYGTTAADGVGSTINQANAGVAGYAFGPAQDGASIGVIGYSSNDNGAWISTGAVSNTYGLYVLQGGALLEAGNSRIGNTLYVDGPLVVTGPKTGYVTDLVRNTGSTDLHPGDVAVVTSAEAGPAQLRNIPLPGVAAATEAYSSGVIGVVDMRWIPADPTARIGTAARTGAYDAQATVIHPGEYMGVVTLGLYKGIKVDASGGPIHVGDLLTSSATAGVAMKAADKLQAMGAVIGKAMGSLDSSTGLIPVMVMLR